MPDDIIEIKPGLGPVKLNARALWRRIVGEKNSEPAVVVADRFAAAFAAHGIALTQIPRFISSLTLRDLNERAALLAALSPKLLDQTAALLGIQRAWLEGTTDRLYRPQSCYKQPLNLFRLLEGVTYDAHSFPVRVLTSARGLDATDSRPQPLVLLVVEKLAPNEDIDQIWDIEKYHVFSDAWDWSYFPARIQLKALARVVDQVLQERVPIFHVSHNELEAVREGRRVPREFVDHCLLTEPSLEDFACAPNESAVAKETDELPLVMRYMIEHSLPQHWPISKT